MMAETKSYGPVTVLYNDQGRWTLDGNYRFQPSVLKSSPKRCYIFMTKEQFNGLRERKGEVLRSFGAPKILASLALEELNGYFGSKTKSNGGSVVKSSTWFQFFVKMAQKVADDETRPDEMEYVPEASGKDYVWYEMRFFSHWEKGSISRNGEAHTLRMLCVDTPPDMAGKLKLLLEERQQEDEAVNFSDPTTLHSVLLDRIITLQDTAVWRVRDRVRAIEKSRARIKGNERFDSMHEIGRHGIHLSEVLNVSIETVEGILAYQESLFEDRQSLIPNLDRGYRVQAQEYLGFQLRAIKAMKARSLSNDKRLDKEITLAYNHIAQSDNTVIKYIAVLTLLFLPSTFVSAIFSTSFFEFQETGWAVSDKFWIFWAVAIPATAVVPIVILLTMEDPKGYLKKKGQACKRAVRRRLGRDTAPIETGEPKAVVGV